MSWVLDTSVLIDVLRGNGEAVEFLRSLDAIPASSEISRIEVLRGLRSAERRRAQRLLDELDWQPVDERVATRAGELGRTWRRSHPGIGIADLAIAATAELHGSKVATANTKHFPMFEGLAPPYAVT